MPKYMYIYVLKKLLRLFPTLFIKKLLCHNYSRETAEILSFEIVLDNGGLWSQKG